MIWWEIKSKKKGNVLKGQFCPKKKMPHASASHVPH